MKKIFFCILTLFLIFTGCVSSSNSGKINQSTDSSREMILDQAIAEAAKRIEERIPEGAKIAPINFNSSSDRFSTYVLDELTANLVENGKLIVVDRSEIDLIRSEFNFQYSGEVGDDSMQALGRMLGAQSIISGSLTDMGGFYRIMIRVLNVQNASVEVQYRTNIINDHVVSTLLNSEDSTTAAKATSSRQTTQTVQSQTPQTVQVPTQPASQTSVQPNVIIVEGASLTEKLLWLEVNAVNNTEYRIEINANESLSAPTLSYPRRRNITVRLISREGERVLSLTGNGSIFTIESDVTLILDNGISLRGRRNNNASLVRVNSRGTLIMNGGAKIIGNTTSLAGGAVYIDENGYFTMTGGEISGNICSNSISSAPGGGVYVSNNGQFNMTGGEIFNNTSKYGGGVSVNGKFIMSGGLISNNTASSESGGGGGVSVHENATFTMAGGEIFGNTARGNGGGVRVFGGTLSMTGGEISGNTASGDGGGIHFYRLEGRGIGTLTKTGGTIYGKAEGNNSNIAKNGQAVGGFRNRNSTTGQTAKLDSRTAGAAGGWE